MDAGLLSSICFCFVCFATVYIMSMFQDTGHGQEERVWRGTGPFQVVMSDQAPSVMT